MKYKMIVSDFDGTLLREDATISEKTVEAISDYIKRGGIFTISTGRMSDSIKKYLPQLNLNGLDIPLMSYHGGLIENAKTNEVIYKIDIEFDTALNIVKEFEKIGVYCHIYDSKKLYVAEETVLNRKYCKKTLSEMHVVGKLSDFMVKSKIDVINILAVPNERYSLEDLYAYFTEMFGDADAQFFTSSPQLFEVAPKLGGKGNGIKIAAKKYGIDISEVIAIGDSMNDISMIKAAGLGIAVDNALDAVKKEAKFMTKANDEDGVRHVIETFCND